MKGFAWTLDINPFWKLKPLADERVLMFWEHTVFTYTKALSDTWEGPCGMTLVFSNFQLNAWGPREPQIPAGRSHFSHSVAAEPPEQEVFKDNGQGPS